MLAKSMYVDPHLLPLSLITRGSPAVTELTGVQARRNSMDNASKNAGDMIQRFQVLYNRQRQAVITGELVEIITGASASEDM